MSKSRTGGVDRTRFMPITGSSAQRRLPQLDGIRALAVVLVLIHHGVAPLLFGGFIGVDVFFVLSGYLITSILLAELGRYGHLRLRRFYVRRLVRLYPSLLLVLLVLFVPALLLAPDRGSYLVGTAAALTYTMPILVQFAHGLLSPWRHTWSLGIEEIFYLAWPVVLLGCIRVVKSRAMRIGILLVVGGLTLLAGILIGPEQELNSYQFRGAGLLFGCALALWLYYWPNVQVSWWAGCVGLASIGAAVVLGTQAGLPGYAVAASTIGSTLLLSHVVTMPAGRISHVFSFGPAAYLGLISYEVYLWHYPLLVMARELFDVQELQVAIWVLPLSVALGAVTQRLLSPLIERWKHAIPY